MADNSKLPLYFQFFNEIGIIGQLSSAILQSKLPDGILAPHFSILNHLVRMGDGRTPLEIAKAFQVPKTTMTHSLGVLEKHKFVELRPNPKDGRSKCVFLTEEGAAFRGQAIQAMAPDMEKLAVGISPDDIADLLPRLAEVRAFLDKMRDHDG